MRCRVLRPEGGTALLFVERARFVSAEMEADGRTDDSKQDEAVIEMGPAKHM